MKENNQNEIWRDIEGYEGAYQISNYGRIKSLERVIIHKGKRSLHKEKILSKLKKNKYIYYQLRRDGKTYRIYAHRLVAQAFIANPENKPQVNHIDGIRHNNYVNNLEWVTRSENLIHAWRIGLSSGTRGKPIYKRRKKIIQKDARGHVLGSFGSIMEASLKTGVSTSSIVMCAKGKIKTAHSYKWEYDTTKM